MSFRVESDYKQRIDAQVQMHVRNLITSMTGFEETDENFGIAEEYMLSNLKQHRFLEADKFRVKREISGLQEKFAIHSQERKGKRLGELVDKFMARKLKPYAVDIHYSIIQFLLLMSNNPISDPANFDDIYAEEQGTKTKQKIQVAPQVRIERMIEESRYIQFASSESLSEDGDEEESEDEVEEQSMFDENSKNNQFWKNGKLKLFEDRSRSSVLEQETSVVCEKSQGNQNQFQTLKKQFHSNNVSGIFAGLAVNQSIWQGSQVESHEKIDYQKETSLQKRTYEQFLVEQNDEERAMFLSIRSFSRADLFRDPNCLASIYESHIKESNSSQQLQLNRWLYETKTERQLVQDVILMLLGQSSPSFILVQGEPPVFKLARKIQLSHLTPAALENLLDQAIDFANSLLKFQFARSLYSEINNISSSFQAFLASIKASQISFQNYLNQFHLLFLHQSAQISRKEIQESLDKKDQLTKGSVVSLMELMSGLRGFQVEMKMMMNMLEGVVEMYSDAMQIQSQQKEQDLGSNSQTHIKAYLATKMIDFLYFQVKEDKAIGQSSSKILMTINAQLFMQCIEPYLGILNDWLHGGFFYDKFSEFFIQNNRNNQNKQQIDSQYQHIDHKIDWNNDFSIRQYQEDETKRTFSVTPRFLQKNEQQILEIGKNVRLIGYVLSEQNYQYPSKQKLKISDIRKDVIESVNLAFQKIEDARKKVLLNIPNSHSVICPEKSQIASTQTKKLKNLRISQILDSKMKAQEKLISESIPQTPQTNASDHSNPFNIFSTATPINLSYSIFSLQTSFAIEPSKNVNQNDARTANLIINQGGSSQKLKESNNTSIKYNHLKKEWNYESGEFIQLFEQSLSEILKDLDIRVKKYLGSLLKETFRLPEHFSALRQIYFMENGSLSTDFSSYLFGNLETSDTLRNIPSIRTYFQELLSNSSNKILEKLSDQFVIEIKNDPINAIFDVECAFLYNHIFQFLLMLKKAQYFLTDKNYFLKRQTKPERYRILRQNDKNSMEIEMDNNDKNRVCVIGNAMKRKMCIVQREFLNFTQAFSYFAFVTVISAKTTEFLEIISKEFDITAFIQIHRAYLKQIADLCFLSKKSSHIFAIISNLLKLCSDFHTQTFRLEVLESLDIRTFCTETTRLQKELHSLKVSSKQHISFLVNYIHSHDDQTLKTACKQIFSKHFLIIFILQQGIPLCQQLNFNNFYIGEEDSTISMLLC